MTKAEMIAEFRFVVHDNAAPPAWSDIRVGYWLSEGQDRFCEKTGFWQDKTTFTIATILDQQDYDIDPRIVSIRSIWDGTRQLIDVTGKTYYLDEMDFSDNPSQSPVHYRTDAETGKITFFEPVLGGVTLTIRAHRRALVALSAANGQPEIPAEFHLAPIEYAAHKAFSDHDRELQDPVKASDHLKNFNAYVRDGRMAYRRLTGEYSDVVANPLYVV